MFKPKEAYLLILFRQLLKLACEGIQIPQLKISDLQSQAFEVNSKLHFK